MQLDAQIGMANLGSAVLQGGRPLYNLDDAQAVSDAAHRGEPDAMRLVAMLVARGLGCKRDWNAAIAWQVAAAEAGDQEAQAELIVMSDDQDYLDYLTILSKKGDGFPLEAWSKLASGVDWRKLLSPPVALTVSQAPLIATARGLASPRFCAWLISRAKPRLSRAVVVHEQKPDVMIDDTRTNSAVAAPFETCGLPILALRERIAKITGLPLENLETPNILHYSPGQEFLPHYDSFDPDAGFMNEDFKKLGQRTATVLIYLNDNYEGGETEFPCINWRFRGRVGETLFWRNLLQGGGRDPSTLHAGKPPLSGEKWMLSQWIRDIPQPEFL